MKPRNKVDYSHWLCVTHINGDLHPHTTVTDRNHSLVQMAPAARELGLEDLTIREPSQRLTVVNDLDEKRLAEKIDKFNVYYKRIMLLNDTEVDIIANGG